MFKMTPTILRNFVGKRATRLYPVVVRPPFPNVRGALRNDMASCDFCGICAAKCPSRCITVDKKSATWQCDPFACVFCGICVDACKTGSLRQDPLYRRPAEDREHIILQGSPAKDKDEKRLTADMAPGIFQGPGAGVRHIRTIDSNPCRFMKHAAPTRKGR